MAEFRHTSSARPIRLGIVGCGEVTSAKHLPAISAIRGVEIAAACDLDRDRCRQVAAEFKIQHVCATIDEVLRIPDLDAVGVCTPPATHAEIAIAALQAGKHVWVDKPLALSEEDGLRMGDEAARAGTVSMTGLHMRFHRLVAAARASIRRGELGRIESIRLAWHSPRSDLNIPAWKTVRVTGGGALVEIAPHHLDLLRFLLGTEIAEISACSNDDVREDENAVLSGRMTDGVLFSGEFSERSPHEIQIVVSGSAAILTLDCLRFEGFNVRAIRQVPGAPVHRLAEAWNFVRTLPTGLKVMRRGGDYRISYFNAWSAFFDAIRRRRVALPSFEDGLRAAQAVSAALCSREQRAVVAVPAPRRPTVNDAPTAPVDSDRPVFSIVVPTFNRPVQLKQLLESLTLQRFARSDFEVIVIDDGGIESLEPIVEPLRERLQIRLLRQSNQGCGPARQSGIEAARGQFLAFTDDDCKPGPEWLLKLHAALLRHPNTAIIGPTVNGLHKDLRAETTQLIVNWLTLAHADLNGDVQYGPTSNLAFPAKPFARIGGLDKSWALAGGEDRDLCARWLEAGLGFYFEPQAQVMHYHSLTIKQFFRQHFNYGRGARRFRRCGGLEQGGYRSYNRIRSYVRLMCLPWRNYHGITVAQMFANLMLAQLATVCGMVVETCAKRPSSTTFTAASPTWSTARSTK